VKIYFDPENATKNKVQPSAVLQDQEFARSLQKTVFFARIKIDWYKGVIESTDSSIVENIDDGDSCPHEFNKFTSHCEKWASRKHLFTDLLI
jgi:hypothetical protein